jgi:hypothetical protein
MRLDTPAWSAWLDAPATTSFSYPVYTPAQGYVAGYMMVCKERRQHGGSMAASTGPPTGASAVACARCIWGLPPP